MHAKGESLARLVALVAPQSSWRLLDVATGAGHTALAFAPHVAKVIASDITDQMLAEARKLAAERGVREEDLAGHVAKRRGAVALVREDVDVAPAEVADVRAMRAWWLPSVLTSWS